MPNHIVNELIFRDLTPGQADELLAATWNGERYDFEKLVPIPPNVWLGSVGSTDIGPYKLNALDWCRQHWGTKWGAYSCLAPVRQEAAGGVKLTFVFETAWSPPYGWLVAVLNRFKVSFDHHWNDEGNSERSGAGRFIYQAGRPFGPFDWREDDADEALHRHMMVLQWGDADDVEIRRPLERLYVRGGR